jgi:hypothetical protein
MRLRRTAVLVAVVALTACGGSHEQRAAPPAPKLPRALAEQLGARSDDVAQKLAAGDECGALASARDLQHQAIAAVNAHQVPAALEEPLLGSANSLVVRITCTPPSPGQQEHVQQMEGEGKKHHAKPKAHGKHGHGDGREGD